MSGDIVQLCSVSNVTHGLTKTLSQSVQNFKFLVAYSDVTASTFITKTEINRTRNESTFFLEIAGFDGASGTVCWFKINTDTSIYFENPIPGGQIKNFKLYGVK